jgi:hypothetical protein
MSMATTTGSKHLVASRIRSPDLEGLARRHCRTMLQQLRTPPPLRDLIAYHAPALEAADLPVQFSPGT